MNNKENFMNWDNPGIALITGASSGIGAEFARQLAEQGFDLILIARRKERLETLCIELQEKYSINAEVLVADLSKLTDNEKVISRISELDNLDVLINNAGFGIMTSFLDTDIKQYIDMINVHFTSPVMFSHAALPIMMKKKRGVIINTSSMSAISRSPTSIMYTTTKAAVAIFSELVRKNFTGSGIYIQALCPGFFYSEFHDTDSMRGFQRDWFPKEAWMNAEEVVSLSLKNAKRINVIFIPGDYNLNNAKNIRKTQVKKYLNAKIL